MNNLVSALSGIASAYENDNEGMVWPSPFSFLLFLLCPDFLLFQASDENLRQPSVNPHYSNRLFPPSNTQNVRYRCEYNGTNSSCYNTPKRKTRQRGSGAWGGRRVGGSVTSNFSGGVLSDDEGILSGEDRAELEFEIVAEGGEEGEEGEGVKREEGKERGREGGREGGGKGDWEARQERGGEGGGFVSSDSGGKFNHIIITTPRELGYMRKDGGRGERERGGEGGVERKKEKLRVIEEERREEKEEDSQEKEEGEISTASTSSGSNSCLATSNKKVPLKRKKKGKSKPYGSFSFCFPSTFPFSSSPPLVPPMVVLVAEDNPVNEAIIKRMLSKGNHDVTCVRNGQEVPFPPSLLPSLPYH